METVNDLQINIRNAFNLVLAVYQESALLIKDLEKKITKKGFQRVNSAAGKYGSVSYEKQISG